MCSHRKLIIVWSTLFCFVFTVLSVDLMKDICSVDCYILGHSSTRSYFVFGLSNFNPLKEFRAYPSFISFVIYLLKSTIKNFCSIIVKVHVRGALRLLIIWQCWLWLVAISGKKITDKSFCTLWYSFSGYGGIMRAIRELTQRLLLEWILQNMVRHFVTHKQVQADKRNPI